LDHAQLALSQEIDLIDQRILDVRLRVAASAELFLNMSEIAQPTIRHGQLIVNAGGFGLAGQSFIEILQSGAVLMLGQGHFAQSCQGG